MQSIISSSIIDEQLKEQFDNSVASLDGDSIGVNLSQAIQESEYWEKEYIKAHQCTEIANEIFTEEVRVNWESLTVDERIILATQYEEAVWRLMSEQWDVSVVPLTFSDELGGAQSDGTIYVHMEYVTNPIEDKNLDMLIQTITHEVRHQYQRGVADMGFWGEYVDPEIDSPGNVYWNWRDSINNYINQNDPNESKEAYYAQSVEIDARAYAALATMYY